MRITRCLMACFMVAGLAYADTENLGMGAFANTDGEILVAVDAALVNRNLDNPYVMFVLFAAAKDRPITVSRDDVVMVHNGREYSLPSVRELRRDYGGVLRDLEFYRRLGKEGLIASWVRLYEFPEQTNFFPPLGLGSELAVERISAYSMVGFETALYFKNPGFSKGDRILIKIRDHKNPAVKGECEIILN